MRTSSLGILLLVLPTARMVAQTPTLQMNIVYVCKDGQSFKVFSCDNITGACDYQNYKNGQAYQRGQALRVQLVALLPAKCHAQTSADAQAAPHRGEVPPAPSPFKARAAGGSNGSASTGAVNSQTGPGGFKVGDTVRVLFDGWQEAKIIEVHGRSYVVHLPNGVDVSKLWPIEVRRLGKLTAEDHAMGQYDLHDRVQVLVNGRWMEGEIRGQNLNMYDIKVPGVDTGFGSDIVNTTPENIRMSTTPAPAAPAQRAAGQAPKAGFVSCAGKYEGRWEHVSGMGGMKSFSVPARQRSPKDWAGRCRSIASRVTARSFFTRPDRSRRSPTTLTSITTERYRRPSEQSRRWATDEAAVCNSLGMRLASEWRASNALFAGNLRVARNRSS